MVCDGETSRLEVAREVVKILGLVGQVKITEVSSEYFKKDYFAARPPCERLLNRKLNLRGLNIMRDWKIALKEYLGSYYKNYL
jgi:dTDP-4-dehydrorhamnose reductase